MNIKALVIDFSRVLINARTDVPSLNRHHEKLAAETPGYKVTDHFILNDELIRFLRGFGQKWPIYLFTDGRLHEVPEIASKLAGLFTSTITAESTGYKKTESKAYLELAYRIGHVPTDLLFVDDQPGNLEAAKASGCAVHQYTTNEELIAFLTGATHA